MRAAAACIAVIGLLAACSPRAKTRCEQACKREAECMEQLELPDFDTTECVTACAELDRDPATQHLVGAHVRCQEQARDCSALVNCP